MQSDSEQGADDRIQRVSLRIRKASRGNATKDRTRNDPPARRLVDAIENAAAALAKLDASPYTIASLEARDRQRLFEALVTLSGLLARRT